MRGENNFISKMFTLSMDMDEMIGGDFEEGLARLAEVAESAAKKATAESDAQAQADLVLETAEDTETEERP
jgi:hypothetical protein